MPTGTPGGGNRRADPPASAGTATDADDREGVVLVVDDDVKFAETVDLWLSRTWTVDVATDGTEALDAYGPHVDVVLLDRRMPVMSGDETLSELRDRDGDARVAMVTAVDPDWSVAEMNFDAYLQKPVSREEVVDTVEALFDRATYAREVRALFALSGKVALLRSQYAADTLANDERYQRLVDEFDRVDREATRQLQDLDDEAFAELMQVVEDGP